MPALDDLVICRDWQPAFRTAGIPPFVGALGPGVLYRWEPYDPNPPKAVGRFEQLKEFRLDRRWKLYENPTNGWSVQLGSWEHELFPAPGEPLEMHLDKVAVPFAVRDASVTTTYTNRSASGELQMEDRAETKRILLPAQGHEGKLVAWIERHHDLSWAREKKARDLRHPRMMYKDKVLRLDVRIVGTPDSGYYELLP